MMYVRIANRISVESECFASPVFCGRAVLSVHTAMVLCLKPPGQKTIQNSFKNLTSFSRIMVVWPIFNMPRIVLVRNLQKIWHISVRNNIGQYYRRCNRDSGYRGSRSFLCFDSPKESMLQAETNPVRRRTPLSVK